MEQVRGVQVRRRDPVTAMKNILAQIDMKAVELEIDAV